MSEYPKKSLSIKTWAEEDRPREKLMEKGKAALTDAELIAILIGSGNSEESAVELSKRILQSVNNNLYELGKYGVHELVQFKGIGEAKAISIIAAVEIGRRRKESESSKKVKVKTSKDVFEAIYPNLADLPHEEFWVILLNRANEIVKNINVSKGGVSGTVVDNRIIFKSAMEQLASSIIICHNHPSGNLKPSQADIKLTNKLKEAGNIMDIPVLDHIIIGDKNYFSFADEGLL